MKKLGIVLLNFFCALILLFLVAWTGLQIAKCVVYPDYLANRKFEEQIPGLSEGFVPQGLSYDGEGGYLHSGYGDGHLLKLFLVKGEDVKQVTPVDEGGNPWEGHGGGIARAGDYVYVASESKLIIFRYDDLKNAQDGASVASIGIFPVDTQASFCFASGNFIYVGEFYRAGDYETNPTHHKTTPAGDDHKALVSCYLLDHNGALAEEYPLYSISIRDQVQGFAVQGDTFILSSSWGVTSSKLDFYKGLTNKGEMIEVSGKSVPLYYLDSATHQKTVDMPAFSEGLTIVGDRVVISFESACNKYVVGKFFFANRLVSYPVQ